MSKINNKTAKTAVEEALLRRDFRTQGEIAKYIGISQGAVSGALRDLGIKEDKKKNAYSLDSKKKRIMQQERLVETLRADKSFRCYPRVKVAYIRVSMYENERVAADIREAFPTNEVLEVICHNHTDIVVYYRRGTTTMESVKRFEDFMSSVRDAESNKPATEPDALDSVPSDSDQPSGK